MPFAFTSASSLFIVSFGPWLLRRVINPSAAIACPPATHTTAVSRKIVRMRVSRVMPIIPTALAQARRDPHGARNDHQVAALPIPGQPPAKQIPTNNNAMELSLAADKFPFVRDAY